MNRFYVITNPTKDQDQKITYMVKNHIEKKGGICVLASEQAQVPEDTECVIVLGGDGTLIRAARELRKNGIPMLGINIGTLGYLTEAENHNYEVALDQILEGNTFVEERMMLSGVFQDEIKDIALNDIVITRRGSMRLICFNVYVNGEMLNSYQADGIIISTPTGSTGYNLSAGGPIVEPTATMFVITPICSHSLSARSIVLSSEDEIVVEIGRSRDGSVEEASIVFDGDHAIEAHTGDRIVIRKAKSTTKLLKLSRVSFLETLREKMKGN